MGGYYTNQDGGDLDKLMGALGNLGVVFGSVDGLLEAFGLKDLPTAQRYGIFFGCLTFFGTVTTVIALLILGGSFQRIKIQEETGQATVLSPTDARKQRALLLEQLMESRAFMIQRNYSDNHTNNNNKNDKDPTYTRLTSMLLNVAPPSAQELPKLLLENKQSQHDAKLAEIRANMPENYEQDYKRAYLECHENPGGPQLAGRPEARYEAYARAYSGCGTRTTSTYRRSYARLYEATACQNLQTDQAFAKLFEERPLDIVGRHVRLEPLEVSRHAHDLYRLTNGEPTLQYKSYDPEEIWGFQPEGPFHSQQDLANSFVFRQAPRDNSSSNSNNSISGKSAAFAVRHNITQELVGAVFLSHDDPWNLSIQLDPPVIGPKFQNTLLELEALFLLLDRLILGYGYRRVQFSCDSQDVASRQLVTRQMQCFTLEGVLHKHLIWKESSRDSNIYAVLNSDWKQTCGKSASARQFLFAKLYGKMTLKADMANEAMQAEREEQQAKLAQLKEQADKAAVDKPNDTSKQESRNK